MLSGSAHSFWGVFESVRCVAIAYRRLWPTGADPGNIAFFTTRSSTTPQRENDRVSDQGSGGAAADNRGQVDDGGLRSKVLPKNMLKWST